MIRKIGITLLGLTTATGLYLNYESKPKKQVYLLGDGFLARGFIQSIDLSQYRITQIYRDPFINPQDLIYKLSHPNSMTSPHIRGFLKRQCINKLKGEITDINIPSKNTKNSIVSVKLDDDLIHQYPIRPEDYLVIGLGAKKSLKEWSDQIANLSSITDKNIGIVGMGPTGIELGSILSKNNTITIFDVLNIKNTLSYLTPIYKVDLISRMEKDGVKFVYETFYNPLQNHFDNVVFCIGNQPNPLTQSLKLNHYLNILGAANIFAGGDCIRQSQYPPTAQLAYEQGKYIAELLNNGISNTKPFKYIDGGIALETRYGTIINGHSYLHDGYYPSWTTWIYSAFFV